MKSDLMPSQHQPKAQHHKAEAMHAPQCARKQQQQTRNFECNVHLNSHFVQEHCVEKGVNGCNSLFHNSKDCSHELQRLEPKLSEQDGSRIRRPFPTDDLKYFSHTFCNVESSSHTLCNVECACFATAPAGLCIP